MKSKSALSKGLGFAHSIIFKNRINFHFVSSSAILEFSTPAFLIRVLADFAAATAAAPRTSGPPGRDIPDGGSSAAGAGTSIKGLSYRLFKLFSPPPPRPAPPAAPCPRPENSESRERRKTKISWLEKWGPRRNRRWIEIPIKYMTRIVIYRSDPRKIGKFFSGTG